MKTIYIGLLLLDYIVSIGVYYYSAKFLSSSTIILNKSVNIKFVNKIKNTILVIGSIIAVTGIAGSLYAIYYPDVYLDRTRVYSGYARTTGALIRPAYCALLASGSTLFTGVLLRILKRKLGPVINENRIHMEKAREKVHFYLAVALPMLMLWLIVPSIGIIAFFIYIFYLNFIKAEL